MNADESNPNEDPIRSWLVECDQALAAGAPPRQPRAADTPVEWLPRLEGDLACIQVLRQVLPRHRTTGGTPVPPATGGTPVPPATGGTPVPPPELPFHSLGRFSIRRLLGQGAFGMVFLAADPQLGRDVALKVPRPEALLTTELRERFVREARAAAALDHPNLVPIYEAGEVGPFCYLASAYCPGLTLSQWLKERSEATPLRLTAWLVAALADAVDHAHQRGVIHRDLKPSNILLHHRTADSAPANRLRQLPSDSPQFDFDFVPRITDFGLAKLIGGAGVSPVHCSGGTGVSPVHCSGGTGVSPVHCSGGTGVSPVQEDGARTLSGQVLGTPNYMAPEQAGGHNKEIGPAADVYALGAILYELLAGRPPFRGDSLLDTLEQVREREPLSPSRLRPKLPRDLETICLKCLQKEPRKRYAGAAALADDLRRYLAGAPIQARPIRAWERGVKWARRRPALATLLAVSVLAPLALAAVVLAYSAKVADANGQLEMRNDQLQQANGDLKEALDAKEEQRQEANKNLRLALFAVDDYAAKVSADDRLKDFRKTLLQLPVKLFEELLKEPPQDPDHEQMYANAYLRLGKLAKELGDHPKAIRAYEEALKRAEVLEKAHPSELTYQILRCDVQNGLAIVYQELRRLKDAASAFQEALHIAKIMVRKYPNDSRCLAVLAQIHNNLAVFHEDIGNFSEAETALGNAREAFAKLSRGHPDFVEFQHGLAANHFNLGRVFSRTNRLEPAAQAFGEACKIWRDLARSHPDKPDYKSGLAGGLTALAVVYNQLGRRAESEKSNVEASNIWGQLCDEFPKIPSYRDNLARSHLQIGQTYTDLGRLDQAEIAYGKAVEKLEELARSYPEAKLYRFGLNVAYEKRSYVSIQLGHYRSALHDLDRYLEFADRVKDDEWRLRHAYALAHTEKHAQAMTEAESFSGHQAIPPPALYRLGCICSLCSVAVRRDAQLSKAERDHRAEQYEARAIEWLKKAKAAGFFEPAAALEEMRKDKDLEALRGRKDFQELFPLPRP